MNRNEIEKWIDENLAFNTKPSKLHRTKTLLIVGMLILCVFVASASLINYFAEIKSEITVEGVIYVNNEQKPIITDSFACWQGNTTNITYNISNIHDAYTYQLNLSIINVDEGLTVTFYNETDVEITNVTILPNSYRLVNFSYYILPNADPEDSPYNATIEIKYLDAWK